MGTCAKCGADGYTVPLHGERGGPHFCIMCAGAWNAEHNPRRKAARALIKAMKAYESAGGTLYGKHFDELKLAASGMFHFDGLDADAAGADFADLTTELLTAALALVHPDKHPPDRKAEAKRVTQELLALKPFVFPAPAPAAAPKPDDVSAKQSAQSFNDPSSKRMSIFPCFDCRETVPSMYCDTCKARWEEKQQQERAQEEEQRLRKNARQRELYGYRKQRRARHTKKPTCATCGNTFEPKRKDAMYCSSACRQRAYVRREGKPSNARPQGTGQIEQAIAELFMSNPDNAYITDDLLAVAYPSLTSTERKHRATVVAVAKKVSERLGKHRDWWQAEGWWSGVAHGTLVFCNRTSVTSYAMARLKTDSLKGYPHRTTEKDLRAKLAPGGDCYRDVIQGGAWWQHTQDFIAEMASSSGNHAA